MVAGFSPHVAALMQSVVAAVQAGDADAAENALRQIVAENPRQADAWHMLAGLAIRAGRTADAIESASKAHQIDRRNPEYLNTLGIAYGEGQRLDDAERCFKRSLKERPNRADTHYNLGKTYAKLGNLAEAGRSYLRARQLDPERSEITNSLVALYVHQGRYKDALPLIAEARSRRPDDELPALYGALAALATSGPDAMFKEFEAYLRVHPESLPVREEFALRLLAEGRFAEGWREYASRRVRPATARSGDPRGRRVLLLQEQGLGDHLFFLRFAARLRERAASVAFDCPAKLVPLLEGNAVVEVLRTGEYARSAFDIELPLGDLPQAVEDWTTPAAFPLATRRSSEWRKRLAELGPPPYLGVTWRAGTRRGSGPEFVASDQGALDKEIPLERLAAALQNWRGTVLILQRVPLPGEVEKFSRALDRPSHDLSKLNDDLEDMAAVLSSIEEYVGVSNTNMHIRAGVQRTARVFVPFPPEFRWMHAGSETPWFPGFPLYRQTAGRDWQPVLDSLSKELTA